MQPEPALDLPGSAEPASSDVGSSDMAFPLPDGFTVHIHTD